MVRKIKGIGVVVVAVLALGAVVASSAQAEKFTSANGVPFTIHGHDTTKSHVLTIGGRAIKCATTTEVQKGATQASYNEVTLDVTFSGCTAEILGNTFDVTITMEGCDTHYTTPTNKVGKFDIKCPAGKSIVVHVYNGTGVEHTDANSICTYTIGEQTNLSHVGYSNNADGTITAKTTVTGIAVTRSKGTLAVCGAGATTATYTGEVLLKGTSAEGVAVPIHVKP